MPKRPVRGSKDQGKLRREKSPSRTQFKNVTRRYVTIKGKRRQRFQSKLTGNWVAKKRIDKNPRVQILLETDHHLTKKGAKKSLAFLKETTSYSEEELIAGGVLNPRTGLLRDNYLKWFEWMAEHTPDVLPDEFKQYLSGVSDVEVGGSDE